MALTLKQSRFCVEYLRDGNGTHAAIRAGCTPAGASTTSTRWLAMPKIKAEISRLRSEAGEFAGQVDLTRILAEISKIAFADPAELYGENGELKNPRQMPQHVRAALMGIDVSDINVGGETIGTIKKVKLNDKNKALDMLMKHMGGYEIDNKQKQTVVQFVVDIVDDDEPLTPEQPAADADDEDDDIED